jgi:hypothetical protein
MYGISTSVHLCGQGDPGINRTWIVVSSWKWSVQVLILISFLKLNLEGFLLR